MAKLKLGPIPDEKPARLTITLSAELAALLRTYADAVGSGKRIVPPILERFIRTDRAFMRTRRHFAHSTARSTESAAAEPS
jgi:hypothetical protein